MCGPGQTNPIACGNCGTNKQTCTAGGAWQDAACLDQGICAPTTTQTCNTYGTQTCSAGCAWGACSCPPTPPVCTPGATQCTSGITAQTCNVCGQWVTSMCTTAQQCVLGACDAITSCAAGGAGLTSCPGATGSESCCTSLEVEGGTFDRSYTRPAGTGVGDPATVSGLRVDKYLVTVGRFRQFVTAWNAGWLPVAGSGKHTHLNAGLGLANSANPGTYEQGWSPSDDGNIAPTNANLSGIYQTWTTSPGSQENLPINGETWYEAAAFCIWDGGFLPSETEWLYTATGGTEYRFYPWGMTDPGTASQYAIYGCYYPSGSGSCAQGVASIAPVGAASMGAGRWGQLDLVGEYFERVQDWYASYVSPCIDCAYLTPNADRVFIGSPYHLGTAYMFFRLDNYDTGDGRQTDSGFRCARIP